MKQSVLFFILLTLSSTIHANPPLNRVGIEVPQARTIADSLIAQGFDVLEGSVSDNYFELIVSLDEWDRLEALGYQLTFLEQGGPLNERVEVQSRSTPVGYKNLDLIIQEMNQFAANFPEICQMVDLTNAYGQSATFEGRHLFAIKISDHVMQDEDEPNILMVSNHHCREIVTPVLALHTIDQLTSLYGTDPAITEIVNGNEIWIAPVWNPDGYNEVFVSDNWWRKNRRVMAGGTGVDLNRNYDFGWDSACAGSTLVSSATYKGPSPASEPETQTMVALSLDRRFAKVIDYHSSGRELLWGYASCLNHPLNNYLQQQATTYSHQSGYGGFERSPSAQGEHYEWQLAELGAFSFLLETHTSFQPTYQSALDEATMIFPGSMWLFSHEIPIWGHTTDLVTGNPVEADLTIDGVVFENGETLHSGGIFGRYHLFLPVGTYQLTFAADSYDDELREITVTPGSSNQLEVTFGRPCPADLNGDRRMDLLELVRIVNHLGESGVPEDIDENGLVELDDLLALIGILGPCP